MSEALPPVSGKRWSRRHTLAAIFVSLLIVALVAAVAHEARTSNLQARYLAKLGSELRYRVEAGPSPSIRFPGAGPYDRRLGYSLLPDFTRRLSGYGFDVVAQARFSPRLASLSEFGLFPAYREKTQAGLTVLDRDGRTIFAARYPERVYSSFDEIPRLVLETLLFIENRELFNTRYPKRNPAVEWDRFAKAAMEQTLHALDVVEDAPGGSTLATQIEKFRHSPEGRTASAREKLRQMASASVRAYLDGEDVSGARRRIVMDYLNSVPLAAHPRYGEVSGLGDGVWVWYGREFEEMNRLMRDPAADPAARAQAYKEMLSLMISQRRPSYFLSGRRAELEALTDAYLRLLTDAGVITPALRDAALRARLDRRSGDVPTHPVSFVTRKAATATRVYLSDMLGIPRLYDVDRLDLTVTTTLDARVQQAVTEALRALKKPDAVAAKGLRGYHLLEGGEDPSKVIYSFTLFERGRDANLLRVQTDNFDEPFDINRGSKLDLGSTAKLRTVVTYLEIIAELHRRYGGLDTDELDEVKPDPRDHLSRWALDFLAGHPGADLPAMLDAALERRYSASPGEAFFTGGGLHTFHNFKKEDDGKILSVRQAFHDSVNLVFVRLMRDMVRYYMYVQAPEEGDPDERRQEYLVRFADREGSEFLQRFYQKYRGKTPEQAEELLLASVKPTPRRLAAVYRTLAPEADRKAFADFLRRRLPPDKVSEAKFDRLYEELAPDRMSLADRGYTARVHPLELWLVGFLRQHPGATLKQVLEAGRDERQDAYAWLFRTRHKHAQERRIQNVREEDAFQAIYRSWKRQGYPFDSLVPSYATALGSSADRPSALAELMGIIVNNGVRLPTVRIEKLHFAAGTPYETVLEQRRKAGERVLAPEVAAAVRRLLVGVVEQGTAQRARGAFARPDGTPMELGGKTGTGDHRFDTFGAGGAVIKSRVVGRSATFVFMLDNRFFGSLTAYVPGPEAADYKFTSSLSVQLLKSLAPALSPLTTSPDAVSRGPVRVVQAGL
jgi:membrane peptidoglycan carboxypeptidase